MIGRFVKRIAQARDWVARTFLQPASVTSVSYQAPAACEDEAGGFEATAGREPMMRGGVNFSTIDQRFGAPSPLMGEGCADLGPLLGGP